MLRREPPRIVCNKCNTNQPYVGQANCDHCHERLNNWSIASQLTVAENKLKEGQK